MIRGSASDSALDSVGVQRGLVEQVIPNGGQDDVTRETMTGDQTGGIGIMPTLTRSAHPTPTSQNQRTSE
jgi:hypothetical protein